MIKLLKTLIIGLMLLVGSQAFAVTDYYVRPHDATAGCQYGACNGTDYANAWEGFAGGNGTPVNWATVDAGDGKLFVAGTHREQMTVPAHGEVGFPIHII